MSASPPGPGQPPAGPVCYRHPGRVAYVSCVRCGRTACPDCLRPASVGQQCLECIRAGNRGPDGRRARQPAGSFGGSVTRQARVTMALLALNVVLYLVLLAYPALANDWAMAGAFLGPDGRVAGVAGGQLYRLITAAFLPGTGFTGLLDIAFNMWALFVIGPALERVLGSVRFLAIYLVSALGGSVLYFLIAPPNQPALGASGAIFGLFGAWFVIARRLGLDSRQVVLLIVLNLGISFAVPFIAWQAHVGGLVAGGLLTLAFAYAPRGYRTAVQVAATVALVALLAVGVVVRDYNLVGSVLL